MRLNTGLTLNLDMANVSMTNGSVQELGSEEPERYETKVEFVVPFMPDEITPGDYQVEYDGKIVVILLRILAGPEEDPVFQFGKNLKFGVPGTGVPTLPFSVFTDNRGHYPCVLATLIFPYRLATWFDKKQETGLRAHDYEETQVTGPPLEEDKTIALKVLNRLIKSRVLNTDFRAVSYDSVTVYTQTYFNKRRGSVLIRLTALAATGAYSSAVERHFLAGFDKPVLAHFLTARAAEIEAKPIETDKELLDVVQAVLTDILVHHIEDRRWVEPFWDGERKIRHKGEEIVVP